jgi:hypothetical protein
VSAVFMDEPAFLCFAKNSSTFNDSLGNFTKSRMSHISREKCLTFTLFTNWKALVS